MLTQLLIGNVRINVVNFHPVSLLAYLILKYIFERRILYIF